MNMYVCMSDEILIHYIVKLLMIDVNIHQTTAIGACRDQLQR
jgi:hypothetical protein